MGLDFSIVRGGPLYWLGQRLGLADRPRGLFQMAAILAAITWLPLLVLNLTRGPVTGGDPTVSFAWSLGTHTRLLAAIPLFLAAEATFDMQTRAALGLTVMMLLPLLVFTPRLVAVSQRGQLDYGVLVTAYTRAFNAKWVRGGVPSDEPLLGTADLQSLADPGNSFESSRGSLVGI